MIVAGDESDDGEHVDAYIRNRRRGQVLRLEGSETDAWIETADVVEIQP